MSEAWRTLQEGYREIDKLYKDAYPPVFARQDWKGAVFAERTLGAGIQVEVWYLAEHFLLAWSDWSGLCERYLRYFGQPDEKLARKWWDLKADCRSLADRMLQDRQLEQLVSMNWMNPSPQGGRREIGSASPRSVSHAMVANHRRHQLFEIVDTEAAPLYSEFHHDSPHGPVWVEAPGVARKLNVELLHDWERLPEDLREDTLWHLRHYQRANLLASWLAPPEPLDSDHHHSALRTVLRTTTAMVPTIERFLEQLHVEAAERHVLIQVIRRLQDAVAEFGYESFVDDVTSGEFLGGEGSPVGSNSINVIPSARKDGCCTTVLAVSKGDKKGIGFPAVMKQLREHLIRCIDKTRVAIILCDHWFPGILDDHLGDLRAHHARGVRFLFLMAGTPERHLAPIAVHLGPPAANGPTVLSESPQQPPIVPSGVRRRIIRPNKDEG